MRLPRRVPWASIGELEQVCNWIFTDETDLDAKALAINRLSAWNQITALPHALEATLSLLSVLVFDTPVSAGAPGAGLRLRQSYAAALIRLVNGLVDPLQLGAYARSIAAIAAQLGLPPWFVELRHAATHEELPSLAVLREGARQAMAWLLHNYFLPQLRPVEGAQPTRKEPQLRPLAPLLKEYKSILKLTTRDGSLRRQYAPRITAALRDIERWIAEAKVAADVADADGLGWGEPARGESGTSDEKLVDGGEEEDVRERWALERLCDALIERGALVPLAKKKRALAAEAFSPPPAVIAIWAPLLAHLKNLHTSFPSVLVDRILAHLLASPSEPASSADGDHVTSKVDPSHDLCLAAWAAWFVETYGAPESVDGTPADDADERVPSAPHLTDVVVTLLSGLGPVVAGRRAPERKAARALLKALTAGTPGLESALATLVSTEPAGAVQSSWAESDLVTMDDRLRSLTGMLSGVRNGVQNGDASRASDTDADVSEAMAVDTGPAPTQAPQTLGEPPALPEGWRLLDQRSGWRPAPIGVFVVCSS